MIAKTEDDYTKRQIAFCIVSLVVFCWIVGWTLSCMVAGVNLHNPSAEIQAARQKQFEAERFAP